MKKVLSPVLRPVKKANISINTPVSARCEHTQLGIGSQQHGNGKYTTLNSEVFRRLCPSFSPSIWGSIANHLEAKAGPSRDLIDWYARSGRRAAAAGAPAAPDYHKIVTETALGAACLLAFAQGHQDYLEEAAIRAQAEARSSPPGRPTESPTGRAGESPRPHGPGAAERTQHPRGPRAAAPRRGHRNN
jgi:hypothetical protein